MKEAAKDATKVNKMQRESENEENYKGSWEEKKRQKNNKLG